MSGWRSLYANNLSLLTDLYELTMAYGYWKLGRADQQAVFHLYFRQLPFGGGYALAAGLECAIDYLQQWRFGEAELAYLRTLNGNDDRPLFDEGFIAWLREFRWTCDVDAVAEGTVVFGDEPLVRVSGPIAQAQLAETVLLNLINYPTLVATKAARICQAAKGEPVYEFGLRRAQGPDGGVTAARAAYIGGCAGTSNVLAGMLFDVPVKGTHAHSWVMSFDDEDEAVEAYADAMPNNCVFLVDTYDSLDGVRKAIEAGRRLRQRGHEMIGIRLDSGDLAYLSIEARRMLDEAGFKDAAIVGSNDLDERIIESLKQQGARIAVWGVGTKLVTAYDQPALGGVYKLGAVRDRVDQSWQPKVKVSEHVNKSTTPGVLQVRRYRGAGGFVGDLIYDQSQFGAPGDGVDVVLEDPADPTRRKRIKGGAAHEDLLQPIFRDGQCVYDRPALEDIRRRARDQLASLHGAIKRFVNPHEYPVGLEQRLRQLKAELVLAARTECDRKEPR